MSTATLTPKAPKTEARREPSLWEPFETMSPFGLTFGRLFDTLWSRPFRTEGSRFLVPDLDLVEDENQFALNVELPGLKKDDVKIEFENGVLSIHGEKKSELEKKGRNYHMMERRYGAFHRALTLPSSVDADKVSAEFTDGVLHVVLPKTEASKPREVKIR